MPVADISACGSSTAFGGGVRAQHEVRSAADLRFRYRGAESASV
jgi:hypothetical protein